MIVLSLMFFSFSFVVFSITTVVYLAYWITNKKWVGQTGTTLTVVGWFSILLTLVFRGIESGHIPWSNLFESTVLLVFVMTTGYLVMEYKYKFKVMGFFSNLIAVICLSSVSLLPFKYKSVEPLNPALQNKWKWLQELLEPVGLKSYAIGWLDVHVFVTFVGYAAFALSFGVAIMYLIRTRADEKKKVGVMMSRLPEAKALDDLSYRAIAWGFPFITAGIVTGAVWANYAWGTYWSWDPKETWSLIAWFIYAGYLHSRITKGWKGRKAAYVSILGFMSIIFLYWGVSFILPGLHAYA